MAIRSLQRVQILGKLNHHISRAAVPTNIRQSSTNTGSDYIIRSARESDVAGVRALSKLSLEDAYPSDYFAGNFLKLLQDPNRIIQVAEKNTDKSLIAAFMAFGGFENGKTFHREARHCLSETQDRGLAMKMMLAISNEFTNRWPDWETCRDSGTTTEHDAHSKDVEILTERIILRLKLTPQILEYYLSLDIAFDENPIFSLSPVQYSTLLSDEKQTRFHYPEGYIVSSHIVFKALSSNVPYITDYHDIIFKNGDVEQQNSGLSVGGHLPVDDDKAWLYNFNYTGATDLHVVNKHLRPHVFQHLRNNTTRKDNYLMIMMPKTFKDKFGEKFLVEYFQEKFLLLSGDIDVSDQYAFSCVPVI